jgi:hypothetical protein
MITGTQLQPEAPQIEMIDAFQRSHKSLPARIGTGSLQGFAEQACRQEALQAGESIAGAALLTAHQPLVVGHHRYPRIPWKRLERLDNSWPLLVVLFGGMAIASCWMLLPPGT